MDGAHPISTPMAIPLVLLSSNKPLEDSTLYKSIVRALQYVTYTTKYHSCCKSCLSIYAHSYLTILGYDETYSSISQGYHPSWPSFTSQFIS